ncbi:MAG: 1-acyl-sn-glycerol-3-phosphate acyltransferase [Bacteroidales bacterium]|jgi:1-acyl-sn-glycerol-3-phosphate acyltransferase|nr:1-acyl-sn-glycerol-3-phosphate acyltransferase [Bacteroidales bacterium]
MGKKRKKRIYERNIYYTVLKYYVGLFYRMSYGKREYHGIEKLPADGALIFAPNHTNALMDAMAVLELDHRPKVFVARADIFKKPLLARIFFFLRIMPINRIRDGRSTLKDNDQVIKNSAEVLKNNVPFVILPEGTHRPMHSLLPLGKGIFRIALLANEEIAGEKPVYIIPMGLEYGNFFRYRSSLLLQIGDPINVTQYVAAHPDSEDPVIMNELKEKLEAAIKELILYIPDDSLYNATLELCNMSCSRRIMQLGLNSNSLKDRLTTNQNTVRLIRERRERDPKTSELILEEIGRFAFMRKRKRISMASVANPRPGLSLASRLFLLVLLFPYFLACTVISGPTLLLTRLICSRMEDQAFHNSVRYVTTLLVWTLTVLVSFFVLFGLVAWEYALAATIVLIPAPMVFYQYYKWFRTARSDFRWLRAGEMRKDKERFVQWIL